MKSKQSVGYLLLILGALLLAGCATPVVEPAAAVEDAPAATKPAAEISQLANPAAVSCQEQGYSYQIRTVEDGGQAGVCLFPDGSECDGWDFYNDDCAPGDSATLEVVEETVLVEPTSTPIVPAEMSVAGWLGHVISDQDDDLLVLHNTTIRVRRSPARTRSCPNVCSCCQGLSDSMCMAPPPTSR